MTVVVHLCGPFVFSWGTGRLVGTALQLQQSYILGRLHCREGAGVYMTRKCLFMVSIEEGSDGVREVRKPRVKAPEGVLVIIG